MWLSRNRTNSSHRGRQKGTIVHALHKSGSMFLFKFFRDIAGRQQTAFYSVNNEPPNHQEIQSGIDHDFILCPERNLNIHSYEFDRLDDIRHIVQIRDPRDILVSEFFSLGWQHTTDHWTQEDLARREKIQRVSIDEFVVNAHLYSKRDLLDRFAPIFDLIDHPRVTIVQYETMVLDFPSWLDQVLTTPGIRNNRHLKRNLLRKYRNEFVPDNQHRRRVIPGDYQDKLLPESIAALNAKYDKILNQFGYSHPDRIGRDT